jgi:hypothetical protein
LAGVELAQQALHVVGVVAVLGVAGAAVQAWGAKNATPLCTHFQAVAARGNRLIRLVN